MKKPFITFILWLGLFIPLAAHAEVPLIVEIIKVEHKKSIGSVTLTGEIIADNLLNISFSTSGRVKAVYVESGDAIKKGDILAKIDAYQQKQAVFALEANLINAQANFDQSTTDLKRQKSLLKKNATTRSQFNTANDGLLIATSSLEKALTQLQSAKETLNDTTVYAPMDGIITSRYLEEGQIVGVAQTVLVIGQGFEAIFDVPEIMLTKKQSQTPIELSLTSHPDKVFTGKVKRISPLINPKKATISVALSLDNPPKSMGIGDVVRGTVFFDADNTITLPYTAITTTKKGTAVWVVDKATMTVAVRQVEILSHLTNEVTINKGLKRDDWVVTKGSHLLFNGRRVAQARFVK